ncbi:MAG: hypothetical protein JNK23_05195 [Opitutaceae bacterium]|nr:hypothetical protein [Opitutaceae bacterium]
MKPLTAVYFGLNLVGMALFAWFVYKIEALARAEERDYRDAFDSITFLTTAVPAFLACVLISCLWLTKVGVDLAWKRGWGSMKAFFAVVCGWAVVLLVFYFLPR